MVKCPGNVVKGADHRKVHRLMTSLQAIMKSTTNVTFGSNPFRLVAEKINKNERKSTAEILNVLQAKEPEEFWKTIGGELNVDITVSECKGELTGTLFFLVHNTIYGYIF